MKKKKILENLILLFLCVTLIYSTSKIASYFLSTWAQTNDEKALRDEVINNDIENNNDSEHITIDFNKLQSINKDIIAWIIIPNTDINYPILKGIDNEYYLNHSYDKSQNSYGSLFFDYRANIYDNDNNQNIIIYGHNLKNGSMFKSLENYMNDKYFNENKTIYLYFPDKTLELEVFSAYSININETLNDQAFFDDEQYQSYLEYIINMSRVSNKISSTEISNQIFTLYTCSYEQKDARYYIHARIK